MNDYQSALDFLYTQHPMFQRAGAPAYKPGLDTSRALDKAFGYPHRAYKTIHVAGTNGKGSTSHTLAAVLQAAGYRTGLYTSPHLVDFRERMRVNGKMISEEEVVDFVSRYRAMCLNLHPSFFELTMMMAFDFFARENVDIAIIEVGLGGRLDSTNIITPEICVITNISYDHTAFLGDTLPMIASEKAGIIKPHIPVVIGEATGEVKQVFINTAARENAPIIFAPQNLTVSPESRDGVMGHMYANTPFGPIWGELAGEYQTANASTIFTALVEMRRRGIASFSDTDVASGFATVSSSTGLLGRWMKVGSRPLTICDTGHNIGGWQYLSRQIAAQPGRKHMVIGFVNDKDIDHILDLMPQDARYYFTRAQIPRALPADALASAAKNKGLHGETFDNVPTAYEAAKGNADAGDTIFVGGSTFVVADFLAYIKSI